MFATAAAFVALAVCTNSTLAQGNSMTTVATFASDSSIAIDSTGNPIIAYRDASTTRLRIMHCNDPACAGGDESVVSPDPQPGQWPSLLLDGAGNPVISYYSTTFDKLKVLHCDDPNCAGFETPRTPDTGTFLLESQTSLALDGSGNPVIAYSPPYEVRIMHCNDAACAGNDESIEAYGSMVAAPSLVLDGLGYPVVAYYQFSGQVSTGTLKVLHCNDLNCAGANDSITTPEPSVGITPSLRLDPSGYPVIAYYTGSTTQDLKVMRCNDALCASNNETINTPDSVNDVGAQPALRLDGNVPMVSYRDGSNGDLKTLRCFDALCSPGSEQIVSWDTSSDSGRNSSFAFDNDGFPAVTFDSGSDLNLLRCADPTCTAGVGGLAAAPAVRAPRGPGSASAWLIAVGAVLLGLLTTAAALNYRRSSN